MSVENNVANYINFNYEPEKFCTELRKLIDERNSRWSKLWQHGLGQMFGDKRFRVPSLNRLLRIIEKAFREGDTNIRKDAFKCWSFLIIMVDKYVPNEKLLEIITRPLCANNHSKVEILDTKLEVWKELLSTTKLYTWMTVEKEVSSVLKILYADDTIITGNSKEYSYMKARCETILSLLVDKFIDVDKDHVILLYVPIIMGNLTIGKYGNILGRKIWSALLIAASKNNWDENLLETILNVLHQLINRPKLSGSAHYNGMVVDFISTMESMPIETFHRIKKTILVKSILCSSPNEDIIASVTMKLINIFPSDEIQIFRKFQTIITQDNACFMHKMNICWSGALNLLCDGLNKKKPMLYSNWLLLVPIQLLYSQWNERIEDAVQYFLRRRIYYVSIRQDESLLDNLAYEIRTIVESSDSLPKLQAVTNILRCYLSNYDRRTDVSLIRELVLDTTEKTLALMEKEPHASYKALMRDYSECFNVLISKHEEGGYRARRLMVKFIRFINVEEVTSTANGKEENTTNSGGGVVTEDDEMSPFHSCPEVETSNTDVPMEQPVLPTA